MLYSNVCTIFFFIDAQSMNDGNPAGGPAAASSSVNHPPAVTGLRRPNQSQIVNQVILIANSNLYHNHDKHCVQSLNQMSHLGSAMPSSNQPARSLNFEGLAANQANLKPVQHQQTISNHQQSALNSPKSNTQTTKFPLTPAIPHSSAVAAASQAPSRLASGGDPPTGPNDVSRMFPSAFPTATSSPNHRPATTNAINSPSQALSIDAANSVSHNIKKRLKLIGGASESTSVDTAAEQHCVALRKRILDHKFSRLKHVKDK